MLKIYENCGNSWAAELGLEKDELLPYGHYMGKIEQQAVLRRLADRPNGKYVDVTAITPTPLGEGKSTTTIGLVQGLSKRGVKTTAAIRQPSGGPTMGMKGSAAGGGLAQCIPLTPYSLNFTGDIHAITSAHNLAMVALTSRMQHERNYDDEKLERLSGMRRLNIDPTRVGMGWAMDFCCQALRNVIIGIEGDGRRNDGFMMRSRFDITAASEIMSIMSLARDLPDLRKRLSRVVLAFDRAGNPVTTADLEVDGAMMAWLLEASKPNLIQTIEGQPVLVHAGPFGNIALGQSSIIADRVALKLSDIHVTESGFGSEIGYEKFWNVKCHMSGLKPDAAVIVATVRALKNHGGAQPPMPGRPLPEPYTREDVGLVEAGCVNLLRHIGIVRRSGVSPVVCINAFATDSKNEIAAIRRICEEAGARVALSEHWLKGGDGALELADAVMDACNEPNNFAPCTTGPCPSNSASRPSPRKSTAPTAWNSPRWPSSASRICKPVPMPRNWASAWSRPSTPCPTTPPSRGRPRAGACMCATACSTAARAWWCRWPATSASCPVRVRVRPSAMWTWIWNPAR